MVRKGELRVLKEEIEGMRCKSVEIARGNTKSESDSSCPYVPVSRSHVSLIIRKSPGLRVWGCDHGHDYLTSVES
jgi:hypothetical protein